MDILQRKDRMGTFEKFADLNPSKILEENMVIARDGSEVLFKVAKEEYQETNKIYISLDLVNGQLKQWPKMFEDRVLSDSNPYAAKSSNPLIKLQSDMQCQLAYNVNDF